MEKWQEDLQKCKVEDNVVYLPSMDEAPLQDYLRLKKNLLDANSKYKRNTFIFPDDARKYVDKLLSGEKINFKKETQFFGTPEDLANRMMENLPEMNDKMNVLEPSAGHGVLIKALWGLCPDVEVVAIEKNALISNILVKNIDELAKNHNAHWICHRNMDFMDYLVMNKFDVIIANPPFTKGQDVDHIRKMYDHLIPGGRLITLSSKSWTFNSQQKYEDFRRWLERIDAIYEKVEMGAFKQSGTMVATMLITIDKPS